MTSIEQIATLATFGAGWAVLSVGHNLADHVIGQTAQQAEGKAAPSAAQVADGVSPAAGLGRMPGTRLFMCGGPPGCRSAGGTPA
ncbi:MULTISPECIES: hypothetical protein [unclassified Streptomyces]|uniref:hypothetical protein n=1 Tax=unclassified Streptomyces TaxID=2593676 RepID=UPI00324D3896